MPPQNNRVRASQSFSIATPSPPGCRRTADRPSAEQAFEKPRAVIAAAVAVSRGPPWVRETTGISFGNTPPGAFSASIRYCSRCSLGRCTRTPPGTNFGRPFRPQSRSREPIPPRHPPVGRTARRTGGRRGAARWWVIRGPWPAEPAVSQARVGWNGVPIPQRRHEPKLVLQLGPHRDRRGSQ